MWGPFNFYSVLLPDEMMNDVDKHMQMMPKQFNVHSICYRPYEIFLCVNITFLLSVASVVAVMVVPENENVIERNFMFASIFYPKRSIGQENIRHFRFIINVNFKHLFISRENSLFWLPF